MITVTYSRRFERMDYELNGKFHRSSGPAVVWDDGRYEWYSYGKRHRYYGASNRYRGDWFIHGKYIKDTLQQI